MFRGIGDIVSILQSFLPPWALAVIAVVALAVGGPAWFDNVRGKQIRGRIRKMLRADGPDARAAYAHEALELAGERPRRLVTLIREAHKYQLNELRDRALERLREGGASPADVEVLDKLVRPESKAAPTSLEAVVRVEKLLDAGLVVGAQEQLDAAMERFPEDPELRQLRSRLEAVRREA
jgi:hypothetical protein